MAATINRILMFLGLAGMFIAGFLSYTHAAKLSIPCGAESGCDKVAQHASAYWMNIPVAYFGLAAYIVLTLLALGRAYAEPPQFRLLSRVGLLISIVGLFTSIYLLYVAIDEIHALCWWCIASGITMLLTFIFHGVLCGKDSIEKAQGWMTDMVAFGIGTVLAFGGVAVYAGQLAKVGDFKPVLEGKNATPEMLVPDEKYFQGSPNARITIVEYADFLCPACRQNFGPFKDFVDKHPDTIRIAFRHLPWFEKEEHAMSVPAAVISEIAADKGKFWAYVGAALTAPPEKVVTIDGLFEIAQKIGLDKDETKQEYQDRQKELVDRVFADYEKAKKMGIQLTPTYIIMADGVPPRAATSTNVVTILQNSPYKEMLAPNAASK